MATDDIEVIFHRPDQLFRRQLEFTSGLTVADALQASGVYAACPEVEAETCKVGVYGEVVTLDRLLDPGDRVEIYRPLIFDPKEARRKRALQAAEAQPKKKGRRRRD